MGLDGPRKPTRTAGEMMVRMTSRLLGAGSALHLHQRLLSEVKSDEEKRLKREMEEVDKDKDLWIVLDNQQSEVVKRAVEEETNLVSIKGPPGSGKTVTGTEIARRLVEKTKEETGEEPVVIVTNVSYKIKEDSAKF